MKTDKTGCNLQSCFMCRLAAKEWKFAIDAHKKNFLVKKGEQFITEGDPVTGVYFVYSGKVKVHKKWGDRELIVRFAHNGAIVGHRGISTRNMVYPISATALENSSVCFVDIDFFMASLKVNPELMLNLMLFYADELQESEKRMRNLALMSVKGRLALALLHLRELFGMDTAGFIDIELSRQDLAAFTGAAYETVFRTLNEFTFDKLIAIAGKRIRITDNGKLVNLTLDNESAG
ncbi:Crp/Fnr family transcriptional regulator (plasmid) [Pedobacter sp. BS3]|uniref:Crp/Fnr family transcriptional regulator n=1 Tax=Pedobacter sp. BS3 TaxID=2567937 RepID=UPI0011EE2824|nr:Crp/Fnr family transcriptional regulator [Pedobacter sp. BS3]TZF85852.1 Crp/Fnr family transcriptional regulator [Pedobacter sp. BS3]